MDVPVTFGLTPARAMRSAALVALLGALGVASLAQIVTREGSPLRVMLSPSLNAGVVFIVGTFVVVAFSLAAARKAIATATEFAVAEGGLWVEGPAGRYLLAWENIDRVGTLFEHDLGIAVVNREAVLGTHSGTAAQRERFERLMREEPYQGWDFHYFRHELGIPVDRVLFLLEQARNPKVLVTRLDEGTGSD